MLPFISQALQVTDVCQRLINMLSISIPRNKQRGYGRILVGPVVSISVENCTVLVIAHIIPFCSHPVILVLVELEKEEHAGTAVD